LVGQHWINGRGPLSTTTAFVIVRTPVSNHPVISIPGQGSSDSLDPITWTITPEMVGMILRIGVGIIGGYEPSDGYENHFTWNMGSEPMVSFEPKDKLVLKDYYTKEDTDKKIEDNEVQQNGKIVRAKKIATYNVITGEEFGN